MSAFMDIVRSLAARLGRGRTSILVAAVLVPALTAAVRRSFPHSMPQAGFPWRW